ncbi:MAG: ABC transporter substrate-binding protein [Lachnospiraceae bacterium]|nr:ABC transporter substrate-binding protein [Lachnospiraceae bacterium]
MKNLFFMKRKLFSLLLAALLTMAVLGGCGSDGTGESSGDNSSMESVKDSTEANSEESSGNSAEANSGEPVYGGSVVVGIQQDIDSLDPHKATAAGTKEILFNIFEGLVKPDKNGDLMNAIASDYTVSEDGLVYTFTLREGVKFHNGNAVTAEDVKYSLERASGLLDGTPLISSLSVLTSVDIIDDKTVQVTVGSANTELIYSFVAAIIPAGSGEDASGTPIGTGPFSFVSYTPQVGIVVKKNADYWQEGLPYLDEVNFKIVNSPDTALMEIQGGSIDIYPYLTDSQANELKSSFRILSAPSVNVQALFLNNADPVLGDVRIRQAICYALDKDMVNDFVAGGNATLISSAMLPTLQTYYVDLNDTYGTGANIEKAKELMTEAGYPDGFDLEITVPSNYEFHMQTAEVVAEELKAAGINAVINPVEWNTWLEECYTNRNYQSTICAITSDMTPGYLMNRFQTDSKKNFINFASAEYDETYQKAAAAMDSAEKAEYYKQLQQILNDEAGSAFIQVPPITIAMNPKLAGYVFYPVYVQDMSTVYFVEN